VDCGPDEDVTDEPPTCVHADEPVMATQADLAEPVHALKKIVAGKG
jgi:hypothetical protein